MSADESGKHPSSLPPQLSNAPPSSGRGAPPSSGGPPSSSGPPPGALLAWGEVRDAITSVHNLEALLKSPRVAGRALGEVLPDFHGGVDVLRRSFASSVAGAGDERIRAGREILARFAFGRLDELGAAMLVASKSELDARSRLALETVVIRVCVDLDAAAELLELSERAVHSVPIELSIEELARASLRSGPAHGRTERELPVRFVNDQTDCVLRADPHVLKRLLAFAIARVAAASPTATGVTVRASCDVPNDARFSIAPSTTRDAAVPSVPMRLVRRTEATDAIVDASSWAAGVTSLFDGAAIGLLVPRVAT